MSFNNKIDTRTLSLILIALIGGVIGGYISNASIKDNEIEGLSNAFIAQLDSKDTEIAALSDTMSSLEEQISQLEASAADPVIGFNTPDYDSGWIEIESGSYVDLNHNLGTTNLFVYLIGGSNFNEYDIHQNDYGGDIYRVPVIDFDENGQSYYSDFDHHMEGVNWRTYGENTIRISRMDADASWPRFRVLLWFLPEPPVVMMP